MDPVRGKRGTERSLCTTDLLRVRDPRGGLRTAYLRRVPYFLAHSLSIIRVSILLRPDVRWQTSYVIPRVAGEVVPAYVTVYYGAQ
jgi:hypothetical protein